MEYTIISDAVNLSQRIEELCKVLGWDLLISDSTYEQVREVVEVGEPWEVPTRGVSRKVCIYPVLGVIGEVSRERRRAYYLRLPREALKTRYSTPRLRRFQTRSHPFLFR
jgi:class 3 adenylate cyclase